MRFLSLISVFVCLVMWSCGKPSGQLKIKNESLVAIPKKDFSIRTFPAPAPGSPEMEVWNGELALFQTKDIHGYMSLWDDDFVGWPDYSQYPVRKPDIEASAADEFQQKEPSPPLPLPVPLAVTVFGDVAVTQYFWPEADQSSPVRYRTTHTWKKGAHGWHIISGMSCEVPRATSSTATR